MAVSRRVWPSALAGFVIFAAFTAVVVVKAPTDAGQLFPPAVGGAVAVALWALIYRVDPAVTLTGGLLLAVFSGNWDRLGLPVGPDRVLIFGGAVVVVAAAVRRGDHRRVVLSPVHWMLIAAFILVIASALGAGTLFERNSLFELTDRYGLIPFALFVVAPLALPGPHQRSVFLAGMVALGLYLGATALFEGVGYTSLVVPDYIADRSVGIHFGRARGPFVEAVAMGFALFACTVSACIALATWKRSGLRLLAGAVALLCATGIVFTLTRQVWLGGGLATILALLASPQLRRYLPVVVAAGVVLVLSLLFFVPGLSGKAEDRFASEKPVWDRLNSNTAGLNMVAERPILGFGWGNFGTESQPYYELAEDYPLTEIRDAHNVFISNAAELGILGLLVWGAALAAVLLGAIQRRGPPEFELWRAGFIAIAVSWLVIANFTPFSYAFSNYLLWFWAGLLYAGDSRRAPGLDWLRGQSRSGATTSSRSHGKRSSNALGY